MIKSIPISYPLLVSSWRICNFLHARSFLTDFRFTKFQFALQFRLAPNQIMERTSETLDATVNAPAVRQGMYLLYSFDRQAFDAAVSGLAGDDHFSHDPARFPVDESGRLGALMKSGSASLDRTTVWMHHDPLATSPSAQFLRSLQPQEPSPSRKLYGATAEVSPQAQALKGWNTGVSLQLASDGKWTTLFPAQGRQED